MERIVTRNNFRRLVKDKPTAILVDCTVGTVAALKVPAEKAAAADFIGKCVDGVFLHFNIFWLDSKHYGVCLFGRMTAIPAADVVFL